MSTHTQPGRIYNQVHVPRKSTPGRRRFSIYITWSYPAEANKDLTELDNRFSSMTEVRRVGWPVFEAPEFANPLMFQQGIAGSLELFFRAWLPFQNVVTESTGHTIPVYQRVDQAGYQLPLDERVLGDTDTLVVWGLDSMEPHRNPARRKSTQCGSSSSARGPA
jgi:hypothetical protein